MGMEDFGGAREIVIRDLAGGGSIIGGFFTGDVRASYAAMQTDGNFVVYRSNGKSLYSTKTDGEEGAFLYLADDGSAAMISADGTRFVGASTPGRATIALPVPPVPPTDTVVVPPPTAGELPSSGVPLDAPVPSARGGTKPVFRYDGCASVATVVRCWFGGATDPDSGAPVPVQFWRSPRSPEDGSALLAAATPDGNGNGYIDIPGDVIAANDAGVGRRITALALDVDAAGTPVGGGSFGSGGRRHLTVTACTGASCDQRLPSETFCDSDSLAVTFAEATQSSAVDTARTSSVELRRSTSCNAWYANATKQVDHTAVASVFAGPPLTQLRQAAAISRKGEGAVTAFQGRLLASSPADIVQACIRVIDFVPGAAGGVLEPVPSLCTDTVNDYRP